jgi:hypothetical protein
MYTRTPWPLIDGDGEIGGVEFSVVSHHALESQLCGASLGDRDADESASVLGHEVDGLWRDLGGCHDEVAFVFTIFVIRDDHHFATADFFDDFLDRIEVGARGSPPEGSFFLHAKEVSVASDFGRSVMRRAIQPPPMTRSPS